MVKIKAILFDYDGTLRDTHRLIYASLDHAFVQHGLSSPNAEQLSPYIHHHSHVHAQFGGNTRFEDFERTYLEKVNELLPAVELYDGAMRVLSALKDEGYKLALVTAATTAKEDTVRQGIAQYFDTIVGAQDITRHKPDPEGVNLALQRLAIDPVQAIMVGDLPTDILAAKAAHLAYAVGVTYGFSAAGSLKQAGADYVVESLPELLQRILTSFPL